MELSHTAHAQRRHWCHRCWCVLVMFRRSFTVVERNAASRQLRLDEVVRDIGALHEAAGRTRSAVSRSGERACLSHAHPLQD